MRISFDGNKEEVTCIRKVEGYKHDYLEVGLSHCEYLIFKSGQEAGEEARARWEDMAKNDPAEFTCIVGEKALVAWCLGQPYAVGTVLVKSLDEWLDLHLTHPEEEFASYNGYEVGMGFSIVEEEEDDNEEWIELLTSVIGVHHKLNKNMYRLAQNSVAYRTN